MNNLSVNVSSTTLGSAAFATLEMVWSKKIFQEDAACASLPWEQEFKNKETNEDNTNMVSSTMQTITWS